jgi:hypothetical protein
LYGIYTSSSLKTLGFVAHRIKGVYVADEDDDEDEDEDEDDDDDDDNDDDDDDDNGFGWYSVLSDSCAAISTSSSSLEYRGTRESFVGGGLGGLDKCDDDDETRPLDVFGVDVGVSFGCFKGLFSLTTDSVNF